MSDLRFHKPLCPLGFYEVTFAQSDCDTSQFAKFVCNCYVVHCTVRDYVYWLCDCILDCCINKLLSCSNILYTLLNISRQLSHRQKFSPSRVTSFSSSHAHCQSQASQHPYAPLPQSHNPGARGIEGSWLFGNMVPNSQLPSMPRSPVLWMPFLTPTNQNTLGFTFLHPSRMSRMWVTPFCWYREILTVKRIFIAINSQCTCTVYRLCWIAAKDLCRVEEYLTADAVRATWRDFSVVQVPTDRLVAFASWSD